MSTFLAKGVASLVDHRPPSALTDLLNINHFPKSSCVGFSIGQRLSPSLSSTLYFVQLSRNPSKV